MPTIYEERYCASTELSIKTRKVEFSQLRGAIPPVRVLVWIPADRTSIDGHVRFISGYTSVRAPSSSNSRTMAT